MSEHKRNKSGIPKKISLLFKGVPNQQNVGVHKPCGAPEQQCAAGTEPELQAPEPQVPQTAKPQMKRTFQQHGLFARFNKRKAKAMAKAEEKLRAAVEQKVKAEAEKMLLTQHRRYTVLAERAMAQAREEIAAAKAQAKQKLAKAKEQIKAEALARAKAEESLEAERKERRRAENQAKDEIAATKAPTEEKLAEAEEKARTEATTRAKAEESLKAEREERQRVEDQAKEAIAATKAEAEEKVRSYAVALTQAEEKLAKAEEKARTEATTRAKAEESLKAEREERQRVEAQAKEAIAPTKAEAEEKVRSYAAALTQAEEKLAKAEEKARTEATTRAKAEEKLKAQWAKRYRLEVQAAEVTKTFKQILQYFFHSITLKRKIALISALAIIFAIALTVSLVKNPPTASYASASTQENQLVATDDVTTTQEDMPVTTKPADMTIHSTAGSIKRKPTNGQMWKPTNDQMWKPTNDQIGTKEAVVVKVADSNRTPALNTQSSTITINPDLPKIAKLTVLDGYNQRNRKTLSADGKTKLVQYSDNKRWGTNVGSYVSYDFPDLSIPVDAAIKSVVVHVEHFEEERFVPGKLEWAVGTGWPTKPVVWASINAPVHEEESHEAVDSWDITNIADTREKINSLQLQIKNKNNVTNKKTLIDYIYVVVEWD